MNADLHEAVARIAEALSAPSIQEGMFGILLSEACRFTGAFTSAIGICDAEREFLDFVAVEGTNQAELLGMRIPFRGSLAADCITTGRTTYSKEPPALCAPVRCEGVITGALIAVGTASAPMREENAGVVELFAGLASAALTLRKRHAHAQQVERELAVLYEAARSVTGSLNVQDVLETILDTVCAHFTHHCAAVFLLNDERTHLFIAAQRGLNEDDTEVQLSACDPQIAAALEAGNAHVVEDDGSKTAPDLSGETDLEHATVPTVIFPGARSAIVAPIRSRNDNLGLLVISSRQPHAYTLGDAKLLEVVAAQSGIAIANAWLFDDATRRAEEATVLYNLSQKVNADLVPDRICTVVAGTALELLGVDQSAVMLHNAREDRLEARAVQGIPLTDFSELRPHPGEGIPGWTYEWVTPTAVADVAADPRNASAPLNAASAICVPVSVGDGDLGVLVGLSQRRRLFTVGEMELLYTVGNLAATALSNALRFEDARAKSAERRRYLIRIARAIGAAPNSWDLPQLLADLAIAVVRADRCAIYKLSDDALTLRAYSGFRPGQRPAENLPLDDPLAGLVVRKGRPVALPGSDAEIRAAGMAAYRRERFSAYLAIPVTIHRRRVGVVEVFRAGERPFLPDEVRLLSHFVRHAGLGERLLGGL